MLYGFGSLTARATGCKLGVTIRPLPVSELIPEQISEARFRLKYAGFLYLKNIVLLTRVQAGAELLSYLIVCGDERL